MRFNLRIVSGYFNHEVAWVRLGTRGYGVHAMHRSFEPLFSERYGFRRYWPKWPRSAWRFGLLGRA